MEYRESYDIRAIRGPQAVFPDQAVPALRPAVVELAQKSTELAFRVLRSLALSLDLVGLRFFRSIVWYFGTFVNSFLCLWEK
jgi:isopenicillin N synthase-like dioxygenase